MPTFNEQCRPDISTLAETEEVQRQFDRETLAWEIATMEARGEDVMAEMELGTHMLIALMVAFIVAALGMAVVITDGLPHVH